MTKTTFEILFSHLHIPEMCANMVSKASKLQGNNFSGIIHHLN